MSSGNALSEWRVSGSPELSKLATTVTANTLHYKDKFGQSVLLLAIEGGADEAIQTLLSKQPPPSLEGSVLLAAAHGRTSLIPLLARAGADVRETNVTGSTALHQAAENGHLDATKLLLEMGLPADSRDRMQRTPLHLAVQSGAVDCVLALLKAGADLAAVDDLGRTAGDVNESMRGAKGVDSDSLSQIYELFKDELELAKRLQETDDSAPAQELPLRTESKHDSRPSTASADGSNVLSATAAATGDGAAPISGIDDVDTLIALILAKFRASVDQKLVGSYRDIYDVLDSAGDGHCSAGDLASGVLLMGIEIMPQLLQPLMERITGKPGVTTLSVEDFEAFCHMSEEQLASFQAVHGDAPVPVAATFPPAIEDLADQLFERIRVGVENEEQPSVEAFYDQIDPRHKGWFDAKMLQAACELWGINAELHEFESVIECIWGINHAGASGSVIHVTKLEFIRFCHGE